MNHGKRLLRRAWALLHTIRVRLTLWYLALLTIILLAFSVFLYTNLSRNLHSEVDRSLRVEAQQLIANLDVENGQPRFGEGWGNLRTDTVAALYDPTGQSLLTNVPRQPLPKLPDVLARAAQGQEQLDTARFPDGAEWRVLTMPVIENGGQVGVLQVARSALSVEATLTQLLALMAIALPLTLLLALAGGLFLAGRALDPIDRITRTAAAISAEDLSQRLNLGGSADEVGRLAATFDRMLDRLDQAFLRQRQFTADASHELRTPLAMLGSQVDVALERHRTPAEYQRVLHSLREDTTRMGQLLSELLMLARADAGQEALDREPLDLNDLAPQVAAAMQPLAQQRSVVLRHEHDARTSIVVQGDQMRLTQLVINLVDNGLKYTPAGGSVTVAVRQEAHWGVLDVADTGVGIAAEDLPHLFERFYRVDRARSREESGAGMGLAICQWIARAHGGEITVESQLHQGTTFSVRLPLLSRQRYAAAAELPNPRRTDPVAPTAGP